ncbi:hypothetical protein ACT009_08440 [Sphingomonas sp. Tas61C01]|uniref:hypothetical protein n=1 Tax=Sphingomonas sp. Tas61C01 TaxID=3458297 RepID=UPI00403E6EF6
MAALIVTTMRQPNECVGGDPIGVIKIMLTVAQRLAYPVATSLLRSPLTRIGKDHAVPPD